MLILFAQEVIENVANQANHATQTADNAVSVSVLTMIMSVVLVAERVWDKYNSRVQKREEAVAKQNEYETKLKFDSTLRELKKENEECSKANTELKESQEKLKKQHQEDVNRIEGKLVECEDKHTEAKLLVDEANKKLDNRFDQVIQLIIKRKEEMEEFKKNQAVSQAEQDTKINKIQSDSETK